MKLRSVILSLAILAGTASLGVVGVANAQSFKTGNDVTVGSNQIINSSVYDAGMTVDISGNINGDVFCVGRDVTITGTVQGDVICAGGTVDIYGNVLGNVRVAGGTINFDGKVGKSLTAAGATFNSSNDSVIGEDATIAGASTTINGSIGRDAVINGRTVIVNGSVGRNLTAYATNTSLGSNAVVNGNLTYHSQNSISLGSGSKIVGSLTKEAPIANRSSGDETFVPLGFWWFVYITVSFLIVAAVLILLFPRKFRDFTEIAVNHFWKSLLVGLVSIVAMMVIVFGLLISVVGIPLAVLSLSIFGLIGLLSLPFAAYYLGRVVYVDSKNAIERMVIGSLILIIASFIPILGIIVDVFALIIGTGIIVQNIIKSAGKISYNI